MLIDLRNLHQLPVATWVGDAELGTRAYNDHFRHLWLRSGWPLPRLGQPLFMTWRPDLVWLRERLLQVARGESGIEGGEGPTDDPGLWYWFMPVHSASGEPGVAMFLEERDESRRSEDIVESVATALRQNFFENMCHELRTPLSAILGFSELIMDEASGTLREYAVRIRDSAGRLLKTMTGILTFADLGQDTVEPQVYPVQLEDHLNAVLALYEPILTNKGICLYRSYSHTPLLLGNHVSVRQIVANIIDNAVRFTPQGSIRVATGTVQRGHRHYVKLEIQDTGVGVSETFLPHIGTPYRQESVGYARTFEGMGLGLAIVQRLCEKQEGFLEFTSQKFVGSICSIYLPAVTPPEECAPTSTATEEILAPMTVS